MYYITLWEGNVRCYGVLKENNRIEQYFTNNRIKYFDTLEDAEKWTKKHKPVTGEEYHIKKRSWE